MNNLENKRLLVSRMEEVGLAEKSFLDIIPPLQLIDDLYVPTFPLEVSTEKDDQENNLEVVNLNIIW